MLRPELYREDIPIAHGEHFHHGADIGVRGVGGSVESAFEQAALALTAVIAEPDAIEARAAIVIECSAPSRELLLADWLNALIYEMATRRMLFCRFQVNLRHDTLCARAWGESIEPDRHQPAVEVKGATYTELGVRRLDSGDWVAHCVVDV